MILCDIDLAKLMSEGLIDEPDYALLNPASIDIRVGRRARIEKGYGVFEYIELDQQVVISPGQFVLVDTLESFRVPNGYAMDLRLKSTTARKGWDHSLAFWVDPGWNGVLTMEIRNCLQHNPLALRSGERFAQAIVHKLSGPSAKPYAGRYNGASQVEAAKE